MTSRVTAVLTTTVTVEIIAKMILRRAKDNLPELLFPFPGAISDWGKKDLIQTTRGVQQGLFNTTAISTCHHHIRRYKLQLQPYS